MDTIFIFFLISIFGPQIIKKIGISVSPTIIVSASLLIIGLTAISLSFGLYYQLPSQEFIKGSGLPLFPALVGIFSLILGVILIFIKNKKNFIKTKDSKSSYIWSLCFLIWLLIALSKYGFLFSIYSPNIFNSDVPIPILGVWVYICGLFFCAIGLYIYLHLKDSKYPETYIWIPMTTIIYCIFQTTLFSLVLSHGLVAEFHSSYPNYSSLLVISYIPMIFVLFIIPFRRNQR